MNQQFIGIGVIAFAVTALLLCLLKPVAARVGLVDHPGGRKTHSHPTPLVGGIAIFSAFAFSVLVFDVPLTDDPIFFTGALLLVAVGALDDLHEIPAQHRLMAQIAAGLLMTLGAGVVLGDIGSAINPNQVVSLGIVAVPLTVFATVGVINAVNMTDGIDGLAAMLVLIALGALGVVAWSGSDLRLIAALEVLGAAILAFLLFNLRARGGALVFLGDAGSLFLGFVLAWFFVQYSQGEQRLLAPVTALWFVALPLIDTVSVMVRRMLMGRSPFVADREHFHHILLGTGLRPKQTLALMVALAGAAAGVGLAGHFLGVAENWMFLGFLGLYSVHFWVTLRASRMRRFLVWPLFQAAEPAD